MSKLRQLKYKKTSIMSMVGMLDKTKPVAFDVETVGFYGRVVLAQFYQSHWDEAIIVSNPDILELSAFLKLLKPLQLVCHNTSYEVSTMQAQLGQVLDQKAFRFNPPKWEDTLLLSKLKYYTQEFFSLDLCYQYALGEDPYINLGLDKKALQKSDWSGVLTLEQEQYAATDVFYLLELYDACNVHHNDPSYRLDKVATGWAWDMQVNGFPYSQDRLDELRADCEARVEELAVPINVNSWQQVRPYIGENESDGLALSTFALNGNDRARDVQEARKLLKLLSFLNKFEAESEDGRLYGKFSFTTRSGRGNCKDMNLQQLPRKTKGLFQAEEGKVFVYADFSALELRYVCALTNETAMEDQFRSGADVHQFTADTMDSTRQVAKTLNFNLTYAVAPHVPGFDSLAGGHN